jgi:hypothetical protein
VSAPVHNTRVRYGPLPELPAEVGIPYANTRDGALTPAHAVRAMLDSDAWRRVMKPELDARERERRARKKVEPAYTCEELESVFLYQVVAGIDTVKKTREQLTSHVGAEARRLLGFNRPRSSKGQVTRLHEVPSEATLSRYRLSFAATGAGNVPAATVGSLAAGEAPSVRDFKRAEVERQRSAIATRADLYTRFLAVWVAEYAKSAEGSSAARALFLDGTALTTLFKCRITRDGRPENDEPRPRERCRVKPVLDKPKAEGGRVVWDGLLSEEQWEALKNQPADFRRYWAYSADGGFGAGAPDSRSGHGYSVVNIVDADGLPIDFKVAPIQADERAGAVSVLADLGERLQLFPDDDGVRVLVGDSGFTGYRVAKRVRELGMLESIHLTSGAARERSQQHAATRRAAKMRVEYTDRKSGKRNLHWYTNGHRELFCDCGKGEVQKRFRRNRDGELVVGLEGRCHTCGPISITSGHWQYAGKRWHKVIGSNPHDEPDLSMGNPLTFGSPIAKAYGKRRFAVQEGVHSILTTRFSLIRGPRRVKYADEARLQTAMTFCVMHLLAAEQRKRANPPVAVNTPTPQRKAA